MLHLFDQIAVLLCQAVGNTLWQGAILWLVLSLVLGFAGRTNAATRSAILLVALFGLLASFLLGIRQAIPHTPQQTTAVIDSAPVNSSSTAAAPSSTVHAILSLPGWAMRVMATLIILITAFRLIQLLRSYLFLTRLKKTCSPLPSLLQTRLDALAEGRAVSGGISNEIPAPVTLGLGSPVILIPADMVESLGPDDLDHVFVHELAHIRRGDDWTRLLQKLLEAPLFFHPATFWITRQLDLEREIACDDSVVLQTGQARPYARCLTRLADSGLRSHRPLLATGMLPGRSQLTRRIHMLLNEDRQISPSISVRALLGVCSLLILPLVLFASTRPVIEMSWREQGLKHMQAAKQEMSQAEAQMLKAAEEKKLAEDEKSLAQAEMAHQAAEMKMAAAQRKLDQARREIHCDSQDHEETMAIPCPHVQPAPPAVEATPEVAMTAPVASATPVADAPAVEDVPAVEPAPPTPAAAVAPIAPVAPPTPATPAAESAPVVVLIKTPHIECTEAHETALVEQQVIRIEHQTKLAELQLKKMDVRIPSIHIVAPKMNLQMRNGKVEVPETRIDLPERHIEILVHSTSERE